MYEASSSHYRRVIGLTIDPFKQTAWSFDTWNSLDLSKPNVSRWGSEFCLWAFLPTWLLLDYQWHHERASWDLKSSQVHISQP